VYVVSLFPDVVIPESPEAYIKLTENTLKTSSGMKQHEFREHATPTKSCFFENRFLLGGIIQAEKSLCSCMKHHLKVLLSVIASFNIILKTCTVLN